MNLCFLVDDNMFDQLSSGGKMAHIVPHDPYNATCKNVSFITMSRDKPSPDYQISFVETVSLDRVFADECFADGVRTPLTEFGLEDDLWDHAWVARDYSAEDEWFVAWPLDNDERSVTVDELLTKSFKTYWTKEYGDYNENDLVDIIFF